MHCSIVAILIWIDFVAAVTISMFAVGARGSIAITVVVVIISVFEVADVYISDLVWVNIINLITKVVIVIIIVVSAVVVVSSN